MSQPASDKERFDAMMDYMHGDRSKEDVADAFDMSPEDRETLALAERLMQDPENTALLEQFMERAAPDIDKFLEEMRQQE